MIHSIHPPGFHPVRRDRLLQEHEHDAYQFKGKLHEPASCPGCGAVYHQGKWQWGSAPQGAALHTCPACMRIRDHFPAGFLFLSGDFFAQNREEIMHLVHNEERREREEHPLKRIMDMEEKGGETVITTTDIHLARMMGDAIHHAYQGELAFHYNPEQNLLRVSWQR